MKLSEQRTCLGSLPDGKQALKIEIATLALMIGL